MKSSFHTIHYNINHRDDFIPSIIFPSTYIRTYFSPKFPPTKANHLYTSTNIGNSSLPTYSTCYFSIQQWQSHYPSDRTLFGTHREKPYYVGTAINMKDGKFAKRSHVKLANRRNLRVSRTTEHSTIKINNAICQLVTFICCNKIYTNVSLQVHFTDAMMVHHDAVLVFAHT